MDWSFLRKFCVLAILLHPLSAQADPNVYRKAAPSTVWFFERGSATGVLVDAENRYVVTAEHVVRETLRSGRSNVKVIFAQADGSGNVLTEKSYYGFEKKRVLPISGKILLSNRLKDIAVIQLEKLPQGLKAIPLAQTMPQPGDNVHVIGNSTFSHGGLFSYSTGKVRNSYFYDTFDSGNCFFALAHHAPTNRGDSGGPVLNDNAELIGIISQGTTGSGSEQVIDHSIHLAEIRHFLTQFNLPIVKSFAFTGTINVPFVTTNAVQGRDSFFLPVAAGKSVSINLNGNGGSDLDLWAFDFDGDKKTGRTLVQQTSGSDDEKGEFKPKHNGVCHVEVRNLPIKDLSITKPNTYTLNFVNQEPQTGPVTVIRNLAAGSMDVVKLEFKASKFKTRVFLRGDGDTDLDLAVLSPSGKVLVQEVGTTDRERGDFIAQDDGIYTIRVLNNSKQQYNQYALWID